MTTSVPRHPSRPVSLLLSPASLLAALLDLLLPGSCGGCDAPGTGLVRRLRGAARPAAVAGAARWAAGRGGGPVPRAAAQRRSRVQGARAARPRRSAGLPARPAAGPDRRARPTCGSSRLRRGRPRPGPAAATTCCGCAGSWRGAIPGLRRRARARAGQAGARLGRAGRRGAGGEPGRAAAGERPGLAAGGRDGDPRRRRRHHRGDAAGLPGAPSLGPVAHVTAAVVLADATTRETIEKYPNGCRKNYALSHLPRSGSLELQICCRTVISDTVGGAPSGTRTGLSGGTTDGCSEVELPLPSVLRRPPRERARSPSGDCRHRPERRGPGTLPGTRRREGRAVGALRPQDRRDWRWSCSTSATAVSSRTASASRSPAVAADPSRVPRRARRTSTPPSTRRSPSSRRACGARTTGAGSPPAARRCWWAAAAAARRCCSTRPRTSRSTYRFPATRWRPTHHPRATSSTARRHGLPRPSARRRDDPRTTSRTTRISTTSTGRAGSSAARCTPRTR